MDDGVLGFLGFVAILIVLDVAALRFGVDSRRLTREPPLPGDPVARIPPDAGRRARGLLTFAALRANALRVQPASPRFLARTASAQRLRRPFRPYVSGDAYGYPRFDLGAAGK
jgi:hypothetical protein